MTSVTPCKEASKSSSTYWLVVSIKSTGNDAVILDRVRADDTLSVSTYWAFTLQRNFMRHPEGYIPSGWIQILISYFMKDALLLQLCIKPLPPFPRVPFRVPRVSLSLPLSPFPLCLSVLFSQFKATNREYLFFSSNYGYLNLYPYCLYILTLRGFPPPIPLFFCDVKRQYRMQAFVLISNISSFI